jgi:integrase/recombinase XerD
VARDPKKLLRDLTEFLGSKNAEKKAKKRQRKLPTFLPDGVAETLLKATATQRDRLAGMLMLFAGLRVSEVCKLQADHLDLKKRVLWVRNGKGGKDRPIPIPQFLARAVRGWLAGRTAGPVFPSPKTGRGLTTRAIQLAVKRWAVAAKLPGAAVSRKYHPHALRHAFACRMLENGATIYEVKELLGHSSIAVTEYYLHSTPDKLAAAVDRVYGG